LGAALVAWMRRQVRRGGTFAGNCGKLPGNFVRQKFRQFHPGHDFRFSADPHCNRGAHCRRDAGSTLEKLRQIADFFSPANLSAKNGRIAELFRLAWKEVLRQPDAHC
jgi:hypothetical protein